LLKPNGSGAKDLAQGFFIGRKEKQENEERYA
jgi:hypothetical protein